MASSFTLGALLATPPQAPLGVPHHPQSLEHRSPARSRSNSPGSELSGAENPDTINADLLRSTQTVSRKRGNDNDLSIVQHIARRVKLSTSEEIDTLVEFANVSHTRFPLTHFLH